MTDEANDESARSAGANPAAPDTPGADAPSGAPPATDTEAAPGAVAVAVREETAVEPVAIETEPAADPRAEARRTRLILPLLLPIGAILVVAFVVFNLSRVFLASSEESKTPAVLVAAGITLTILIGASLIAAFPDIRTSSLVIGLCGVMLVVLMAGSLVLGAASPKTKAAAGYVEPAGPAIHTLEVDALPTLSFQAKSFNVPAGVNQIQYVDKGGTHTLVFDKNAVPGFELMVPNGKSAAKVDLKANTTYTVYCTIPGHRAAGMQADIIVGAPGGTPQPGTKSPTQTTVPAGKAPAPGTPTTAPSASQSSTGGT